MKKDVIIIGAGAAGLMCAIHAGRRGRSVVVLDHMEKAGKKIRISGGGHCNFTNLRMDHEHYLSCNPHFCKSALARFTPDDFVAMLERRGLGCYEKGEGQLFCRQGARAVMAVLEKECREAGAEIALNQRISSVRKDDIFIVATGYGEIEAPSVVVATGGLSYPELGATGMGYRVARYFGLRITPLKPALVPFVFRGKEAGLFRRLSGVSIEGVVTCGNRDFRGGILFTHRGLSGPAALQASCCWEKGDSITLNVVPDMDAYEICMSGRKSKAELRNFLAGLVPRRFAAAWCEEYVPSRPLNQFTGKELEAVACGLRTWRITPAGTEGYGKAEVTRGGIDTDELSSKTMEAKKVPGLFFAGEVIDVTGLLGGYNLHWAWASGYAVGRHV
ncbi:MAG: NAD(P)/FAD-dependent oxidoreductase [Nitrospirae bacterium]|nr:NAD(P)/FAD-dependent oxidoreductase [Nitrospirota bacterium]